MGQDDLNFKEVKVKDIDNKSPILYPTRKIEIKTSKEPAIGPSRMASIYEYNQRAEVPTEVNVNNPVSISSHKMSLNRLMSFLKQNGSYLNLSSQIDDEIDRMKYSSLALYILQPTINKYWKKIPKTEEKIEVKPAVDYLNTHTNEREDFLKLAVKLQMDAGFEIISIPYLKLPLSDYKTLIRSSVKTLRAQNKEPLIVFDLDYKPYRGAFSDAIKFIIEDADVKLIAFPHKSFRRAAASYTALSRYSTKDVAFLSFDVMRTHSYENNLSKMHEAPFVGTDLYSIATPRYIPDEDEEEERTKESIKFFNQSNLLVETSSIRMKDPEKILEEMGMTKDAELRNILDNYDSIGKDQDKIKVFNALSKVHELNSSTKEFDTVQKRVKSSESTEYIKEKPYLHSTLTTLQKKKPKSA